jgi:hypothetical protein
LLIKSVLALFKILNITILNAICIFYLIYSYISDYNMFWSHNAIVRYMLVPWVIVCSVLCHTSIFNTKCSKWK